MRVFSFYFNLILIFVCYNADIGDDKMDSNEMIEMVADIIYDERGIDDNSMNYREAKRVATLIVEKLEEKELLR